MKVTGQQGIIDETSGKTSGKFPVSFSLSSRVLGSSRIRNIATQKLAPRFQELSQRFHLPPKIAAGVFSAVVASFGALKFVHLSCEVRADTSVSHLHGFGFDKKTGQTVHSDCRDLVNLRMFFLAPSEQELESSYPSQHRRRFLRNAFKETGIEIVAKLLDAAQAINDADLKYESSHKIKLLFWRTPSPTNSAAGLMACLQYAGLVKRPAWTIKSFIKFHMAPGMRRGLLKDLEIKSHYREMAKDGVTMDGLFEDFRQRNPWRPAVQSEPIALRQGVAHAIA